MSRVVLAMSGGVDSSVAAWLLREQGHEVIGLFMRHGQERTPSPPAPRTALARGEFGKQGCCTAADAADARRVADVLGIPFYAVNFQPEFDRIVDYFVAEYAAGRTPNPCIVCNTWLKFGRLLDYADRLGAQYVATGHYARLVRLGWDSSGAVRTDGHRITPGGTGARCPTLAVGTTIALCRGRDPSKDQSYVLFGIRPALLPRLLFPVGEYCKEEIRQIAERLGLRVAAKRDSQEICFVPDQDHARFVRQRRGAIDTSGEIVTTDGTVVGRHAGIEQFTVGQRKGLRLAFGQPRYVVRIEPDAAPRRDRHARRPRPDGTDRRRGELAGREGRVERGEGGEREMGRVPSARSPADSPLRLSPLPSPLLPRQVKIRYRSPPAEATVERLPGGRFRVCFDRPCYGIAPGQAAVCYQGDRVLGGGWIEGPALSSRGRHLLPAGRYNTVFPSRKRVLLPP